MVVVRLLNLSALLCRSAAGAHLLDFPEQLLGVDRTCLYVAGSESGASGLLRSCAADALGQIVLVVFGRLRRRSQTASSSPARGMHRSNGSGRVPFGRGRSASVRNDPAHAKCLRGWSCEVNARSASRGRAGEVSVPRAPAVGALIGAALLLSLLCLGMWIVRARAVPRDDVEVEVGEKDADLSDGEANMEDPSDEEASVEEVMQEFVALDGADWRRRIQNVLAGSFAGDAKW